MTHYRAESHYWFQSQRVADVYPRGSELTDYLEGYFPPENWEDIKAMLGADLPELAQIDRLRSAVQYTCPSLLLAKPLRKQGVLPTSIGLTGSGGL